jgi:hypothetical protein
MLEPSPAMSNRKATAVALSKWQSLHFQTKLLAVLVLVVFCVMVVFDPSFVSAVLKDILRAILELISDERWLE